MITAKPEIVNSEKPIEHLRDRNDPQYWQMRQKNDEFLRRQYWWARHHLNGTFKSQRQRELQALAEEAEWLVKKLAEKMGYLSNLTTYKCPFDLQIWDDAGRTIRVEVKISRWNEKSRRFQANIRHDKADLLVFIARNGQDWHFVIPMKRITPWTVPQESEHIWKEISPHPKTRISANS